MAGAHRTRASHRKLRPCIPGRRGHLGGMATAAVTPTEPAAPVNVTLAQLVAEGLRIQHRFTPEPVYARTGRGFLRSSGISEIAEAKARERVTPKGRRQR